MFHPSELWSTMLLIYFRYCELTSMHLYPSVLVERWLAMETWARACWVLICHGDMGACCVGAEQPWRGSMHWVGADQQWKHGCVLNWCWGAI